jgi:branched-chain amino acid transport system permease protein
MSFLTALIEGVLLGGYYAMLACGLSFMFGVMRIINLAHGSLAIVAAFALWTIADRYEYDPFLALIVVLPVMAGLGWLLQRGVLERSARSGELIPILSTFGLAIVVENVLFECFGADIRSLAPYVGSLAYDSFDIGGGILYRRIGDTHIRCRHPTVGRPAIIPYLYNTRTPNTRHGRRSGHR